MKSGRCTRRLSISSLVTQRGVSLLFSLMALVVLGFASIALVRAVGTGSMVMGNLGFKEDAGAASFSGAEGAISWLRTNLTGSGLDADLPSLGYYATSMDDLDPTGMGSSPLRHVVKWNPTYCTGTYASCTTTPYTSPTLINGNKVMWIVTRLCAIAGPVESPNSCSRPPLSVTAVVNDRGEVVSGGRITTGTTTPYFRIIVRVEGPRNTVSFTESMIHF